MIDSHHTCPPISGVDAPLFGTQSNTQMAVVVPSGARTGRVVVTTLGSTATSLTDFTVQTGSGVPLGFAELPVRVFPSPAESMLNIETSLQAASVVQFHVVSASGLTLLTRESRVSAGAYRTSLDVSSLPSGVYVCACAGRNASVGGENYQALRLSCFNRRC